MFQLCILRKLIIFVKVDIHFCVFVSSESDKSKDWEQLICQSKIMFEKQLQSERTLKTQVSHF